jgi:hypothetical protein
LTTRARGEKLQPDYDYVLEDFEYDQIVDSDPLKYRGYVYWQRTQNEPSALRGLQIYIRNVGIGPYDKTLLGFSRVNPSSRVGQLSGEIYVEEGLERALNVDRNSFRETDAHYVALREHIWQLLGSVTRGDGILGRSIDAYDMRKKRQETQEWQESVERLSAQVTNISKGKLELQILKQDHPEPYSVQENTLVVYDGSSRWPRPSKERLKAQEILVAVRVAIEAGANAQKILTLLEKLLLR